MMHARSNVLFAVSGIAAVLGLGLAASCGSSTSESTPDAGGAVLQDAASDSGGTDAVSDTASSDVSPDVPAADAADDGPWQPSGDPGWTEWLPNECPKMQVATNPQHAVPPLEWDACPGGLAGCEYLRENWLHPNTAAGFISPKVYKNGGTIRISMNFKWSGGEWRKAIYSEDMEPIAAWRGDSSTPNCVGTYLEWTEQHACIVLARSLAGGYDTPSIHAFLDSSDGNLLSFAGSQAKVGGYGCTSDILATKHMTSVGYIRDIPADVEHILEPPGAMTFKMAPHDDYALVTLWSSSAGAEVLDGWIWTRPNTLTKLVDPGGELIYDMQTDGETLVWVQMPSESIYDNSVGDLWTSPFSKDPSEIQPTKRRSVPKTSSSGDYGKVGPGYYMLAEGNFSSQNSQTKTHVYRLSDARHWEVPNPAQTRALSQLHVDAEEVWFMAEMDDPFPLWTIIRQRLDVLGPGD